MGVNALAYRLRGTALFLSIDPASRSDAVDEHVTYRWEQPWGATDRPDDAE